MRKLIFFILLLPLTTQAKVTSFKLDRGEFKLNLKKNWVPFFEAYGLAFSILGPVYGQSRPVLQITPTAQAVNFHIGSTFLALDKYKKDRSAFIRSMKGKVKSFHPYKITKWPSISLAHHFAYEYSIGNLNYQEHSLYLECKNGMLYHAKILAKGERRKHAAEKSIELLKTLRCLK